MSHGLQALVSYTLAKSTDTASNDAGGYSAHKLSDLSNIGLNEGYSDFDVRHTYSGGFSYELPAPAWGRAGHALVKGWALDGIVKGRSAYPVNVVSYPPIVMNGIAQYLRPNVVPGQPFWISDPNAPGGRRLNPAAFSAPVNNMPGNLTRNTLRDFPAVQADLALRRRFDLTERVKLDLRAEYFNVFNHPMFSFAGGAARYWGYSAFGKATSTLNTAFGGSTGGGGLNSQYQMGGPRSGQLTLKISF
jgi:hypothetical protein